MHNNMQACLSQSEREDFIALMLRASEINPNVDLSEEDLVMKTEDDGTTVGKASIVERPLKGLTMEVRVDLHETAEMTGKVKCGFV